MEKVLQPQDPLESDTYMVNEFFTHMPKQVPNSQVLFYFIL